MDVISRLVGLLDLGGDVPWQICCEAPCYSKVVFTKQSKETLGVRRFRVHLRHKQHTMFRAYIRNIQGNHDKEP